MKKTLYASVLGIVVFLSMFSMVYALSANGNMNVLGKSLRVESAENNSEDIIVGNVRAKVRLNLSSEEFENKTILKALMSNGRFAEVKILPDRASETAQERLRAKCEERNCTFELKEVGTGNQTRLAYEMSAEKEARLFLLFKNKMEVKAQVDAETGEIISVKKPWWAFLASED